MFIDTKNNLRVFLIRHGQNQFLKNQIQNAKKNYEWGNFNGSAEYTKQIK